VGGRSYIWNRKNGLKVGHHRDVRGYSSGDRETLSGSRLFQAGAMGEKCTEFNFKIARYRQIASRIVDQPTLHAEQETLVTRQHWAAKPIRASTMGQELFFRQ
jgi:hypothetical protein